MAGTVSPTATLVAGSVPFSQSAIVGLTVAKAVELYGSALNIPATARPTVNGKAVESTHIIAAGETVQFDEPTGRKGN